jgi:hypothetical protein
MGPPCIVTLAITGSLPGKKHDLAVRGSMLGL